DQRSTRRSPDHLHLGVLGEAKFAANRTPREAGVCSSTSALNGRWRLISAMYACAREGPYKIPCAIATRKDREAGVFDVRSSVILNHLIWDGGLAAPWLRAGRPSGGPVLDARGHPRIAILRIYCAPEFCSRQTLSLYGDLTLVHPDWQCDHGRDTDGVHRVD